jgi:preprotein translocase subunit Sec63
MQETRRQDFPKFHTDKIANSSNSSNFGEEIAQRDSNVPPAAKIQKERQGAGRSRCLRITIAAIIVVFCMLQYQGKLFQYRETDVSQDLYEVLGVKSTASLLDIRKNYKLLMKDYYPDWHSDCKTCLEHYQRVFNAFLVLRDPVKREEYDHSRIPPINSKVITLANF